MSKMEVELKRGDDDNPLKYSLEAVLPGVHSRMSTTTLEVSGLRRNVEGVKTELKQVRNSLQKDLKGVQDSLQDFIREEMGEALTKLAAGITAGANNYRSCTNVRARYEAEEEEDKAEEGQLPDGDNDDIPVEAKSHHLKFSHKTLQSLYDEWYGDGEFTGRPIPGGIAWLEKHHKHMWRKHFTSGQNKHFSRVKRIVKGIEAEAEKNQKIPDEVIEEWQEIFEGEMKWLVSKMEEWMKKQGLLTKQAPHGKRPRIS